MTDKTGRKPEHRMGKVLLETSCILLLCSLCAFLDLFLIHHGDGQGFARGYVWVVVDGLIVLFWTTCLILRHFGVRPAAQLPQQPGGNICKEFLYAYASWLVFAPLQVAKIARVYNTVHKPSEVHWVFTPAMLRIALSLTGILFVLLVYSHDCDVDNPKYKLRLRSLGGVVGISMLDGCDILSMLHVRGASDMYPTTLRNTMLVFGCVWFILPLLPMVALRIMAAEKDQQALALEKRKQTRQGRNERRKKEIRKLDIKLKMPSTEINDSNLRPAKSLDFPQFERKVIQLRNDMFVSELNKSCKNREQRCKSVDDLCSDAAAQTNRAIAHTKLSQSLNFSYWNYNQNCKVEAPTLEKRHRKAKDRKDRSASYLDTEGENDANHHQEKKKDHVTLEMLRHSKSAFFNMILLRNKFLVSTMDMPYLAIRFHLWLGHGVSASVFLTKNILMILGLLLHLFHEPPSALKKSKAKRKALDVGMMAGIGFP